MEMSLLSLSDLNPACYLPDVAKSKLSNALPSLTSSLRCSKSSSPAMHSFEVVTKSVLYPLELIYKLGTSISAPNLYPTMTKQPRALAWPASNLLFFPLLYWSRATTFNMAFFWLNWAIISRTVDSWTITAFAYTIIRVFLYLIPSITMLFFDLTFPSLMHNLKRCGRYGLPIHGTIRRGRKDTQKWILVLLTSICNFLLGLSLYCGLEATLANLKLPISTSTSAIAPLPGSVLLNLFYAFLLRDFLTWISHCVLHSSFSPHLYQLHKSHYHAATLMSGPFPLSATYDHPWAYLLHTWLPFYLSVYILQMHTFTFIIYTALIAIEETVGNSGYGYLSWVPTNWIYGNIKRDREEHCLGGGERRFGTLGVADWVFGTGARRETWRPPCEDGEDEMDETNEPDIQAADDPFSIEDADKPRIRQSRIRAMENKKEKQGRRLSRIRTRPAPAVRKVAEVAEVLSQPDLEEDEIVIETESPTKDHARIANSAVPRVKRDVLNGAGPSRRSARNVRQNDGTEDDD